MDLSHVIVGPIVTEKAERGKTQSCYTLTIRNEATKIDVKNAIKKFYDVDVKSVRVQRVGRKTRDLGAGRILTRRHPFKKAYITLKDAKASLDFSKFKTA